MMGIGQLNHLWQSTCFAIVAGLLTVILRKNRANVRYWLWLSASLKFFIPFALLMNLGSQLQFTPVAQKLATQIAAPAVSFTVEQISQPFVFNPAPAPVNPHPDSSILPFVVLGLWLAGVFTIALMRFRGWLQVRAAVRASTPLGIPSTVEIRAAAGLLEPGVVGVVHPVLLVPEGITEQLSPSQLEAVLAHELCHVSRRDNLFASIHMIVEMLFWFHPLVWWIGARLLEERERACDEEVLNLGNQPRVYADAILNVCKLYAESPLACVSGVTGSDIKRRIEAIMTNRRGQTLNRAKKILLASAGFAAVAGPVMIGVLIGIGHLPAIHAQSLVVAPLLPQLTIPTIAQSVQAPSFPQPPATTGQAVPAASATVAKYVDRRLVAMLFDLSGMSAGEQSQTQAAGLTFVRDGLKPGDVVTVMVATGDSGPMVLQDFTDNPASLQAAVQNVIVEGGRSAAIGSAVRLATISTVARILAPFPQKKALMYYSIVTPSGAEDQAALLDAINAAKQANVAIYPVVIGSVAGGPVGPVAGTGSGVPGGRGRGPGRGASPPAGVSQDEYDRRVAYVQTTFGSTNNAMARTYLRYGAPDQVDAPNSGNAQIWRYNYLEDFHGGAAFELSASAPLGARVLYPPPTATYEGQTAVVAQLTPLANALAKEAQAQGKPADTSVISGFTGRHVSIQIYPASPLTLPSPDRKSASVSVPLDGLLGPVDVVAQVRARTDSGAVAGNLRDSTAASSGVYQSAFTLQPGNYVINVLLKEQSTGRLFGETINFDVK